MQADVVIDPSRGLKLPSDVYRLDDHQTCALSQTASLYCKHCGERFPMPLGRLEFVVGLGRAFARAHRHCR